MKNQTVKIDKESNSTANEDLHSRETPQFVNLPAEDECSCPCNGVPPAPVCGKTTNGISKTFTSQCHLICHNQCGSAESKNHNQLFTTIIDSITTINDLQDMRSSPKAIVRSFRSPLEVTNLRIFV